MLLTAVKDMHGEINILISNAETVALIALLGQHILNFAG